MYDSWGKIISITDENRNEITDEEDIGLINPYRYRGYRYDSETGLYYLHSRYYNPEWSRFINADGTVNSGDQLLGHNLYTYCNNNPINMADPSGNAAFSLSNIIKKVVQTVVNAVKKVVASVSTTVKNNTSSTVKSTSTSTAISTSRTTNNNFVLANKNKLPTEGQTPNSRLKAPNGDVRVYGPDGRALKDIDSSHHHHHPELENPHEHDWEWDGNTPSRGKAHNFTDTAVKTTAAVGGTIIIYEIVKWGLAVIFAAPTGGGSLAGVAIVP